MSRADLEIELQNPDFRDRLFIAESSYQHFLRLADYHYIKSDIRPYLRIYGLYGKGRYYQQYPRPIAVTVYAPPMPNLKGRNIAVKGILDIPSKPRERMSVLNNNIVYASRLICDPRFSGKGLAAWLAAETIPLCGKPIVETLTPLGVANRLCARIGFKQYMVPSPVRYSRIHRTLAECGITWELCRFPELVHKRIESISGPGRDKLDYELQRFVNHYSYHLFPIHSLARTRYIVSKLVYPSVYHIWIERNWLNSRRIPKENADKVPRKNHAKTTSNQHRKQ